MSSWLSGIASQAEKLLESVDQAAAETIQPIISHSATVSSADALRDQTTAAPAFSLTSTSTSVAATPIKTVKSVATYDENELIDFLNSKSSSETKRRDPLSVEPSRSLSTSAAGGLGIKTTKVTSQQPSTEQESGLAVENRLLKNEVASLTDEVASFASRIRALQELQADMRNQMAALERRERQLASLNKDGQNREEELQRKLSAAENEAKTVRKTLEQAEQRMRDLKAEKQMVLNDHSLSSEVQVSAFNTLKTELAKAQQELKEERSKSDATSKTLEHRLTALQTTVDQLTQELKSVRVTHAAEKGNTRQHTCIHTYILTYLHAHIYLPFILARISSCTPVHSFQIFCKQF
jgi:hypothetical protein